MRISDWSSDVCSSDLTANRRWASAGSEPINRYPYCCGAVRQAIGEAGYKTCLAPRINLPQPHRTAASRRSEEHTSELQSLMRISYAVFCLKKKKHYTKQHYIN